MLSCRSQVESSASKPFSSSSLNQAQRLGTASLWDAGWRKAQLLRAKQLSLKNEGLFKESRASLISQLHARKKNDDAAATITTKIKVGVNPIERMQNSAPSWITGVRHLERSFASFATTRSQSTCTCKSIQSPAKFVAWSCERLDVFLVHFAVALFGYASHLQCGWWRWTLLVRWPRSSGDVSVLRQGRKECP